MPCRITPIHPLQSTLCIFRDWAITFDDEVELIWFKSNNSWLKWLFLFARYFTIAVQICNRSLDYFIINCYDLNISALRTWFVFQVIIAALSVCTLEIVLMARVYAMYNQERWVGVVFILLVILENMVTVTGLVLTLPHHDFRREDILSRLPSSFAYFGISAIIVQSVILILTVTKCAQNHWKQIPLLRLMFRDGTMAFVALSLFCIVMVIYTLIDLSFSVTGYAWLLTAISCVGSRIIINLQRLPPSVNTDDRIQFTSVFTDFLD
ncbi:hypothetical protein BDQ17DRAFT_1232420 [Cyathus striatus]|nr:hypothetical protein BDQ17DRAFT_1232420 [Cyathus striatus]